MWFLPVQVNGAIIFRLVNFQEVIRSQVLQHSVFQDLEAQREVVGHVPPALRCEAQEVGRRERYHGEMEDSPDGAQFSCLRNETLRAFHGADIAGGHQHLDAHPLPLTNPLGLVTCTAEHAESPR